MVVAPATFNTINKWAAGINDTYALGVLNEALGAGLPTVVSLYAKSALAAHPAFASSLERLKSAGAFVTGTEAIKPGGDGMPYRWSVIIDAVVSLRRA